MITKKLPRLTGSRCQCSACGELFNSVSTFDQHRKGSCNSHSQARRCLGIEEMMQLGWTKNKSDFWISRRSPYQTHRINDCAMEVL